MRTLSWIGMTWVDWRGSACCPQCFFICLREENSWLVAWEGISHSISRNWMCCVVRRLCWNTILNHVCTCVPCMPHSFCSPLQQWILPGLNGEHAVTGKQPSWAISAQSSFKLFFLRLIESYSSSRLRLIFSIIHPHVLRPRKRKACCMKILVIFKTLNCLSDPIQFDSRGYCTTYLYLSAA